MLLALLGERPLRRALSSRVVRYVDVGELRREVDLGMKDV